MKRRSFLQALLGTNGIHHVLPLIVSHLFI